MRRGLGRGEAWEAVNDVLPCLGEGDTRALAVVQLECFSAVSGHKNPPCLRAATWRPLLWGWGWRRLAGQENQGLISFALRPSGAPGQRHLFHRMIE